MSREEKTKRRPAEPHIRALGELLKRPKPRQEKEEPEASDQG